MRGWCLTDSFIEDFKALHCFSQLNVIRIMVNATMKRVILESQVSRDLTGNIISWIRSFRQTLAVQFVSKSKQSDWLLKIRSNLIAYWLNGVTTLGKTRVAFVYKMNPPFNCLVLTRMMNFSATRSTRKMRRRRNRFESHSKLSDII